MKRIADMPRDLLRMSVFSINLLTLIIAAALLVACSDEPEESIEITGRGSVNVSEGHDSIPGVIDRDPETWWTSYDFAPQWLALRFNIAQPVNRIELSVAQSEEGLTTHEVWLRSESEVLTLFKRYVNIPTADKDLLVISIDPPQYITEALIVTLEGVGWVAWREVRAFAPSNLHYSTFSETGFRLANPVQATHAGDGSGRLFVVEKEGRIRIVRDDLLVETPFLDIAERVSAVEVEMGLLNVAFPPSYENLKQFYVSYSDSNGDTVISRFTTSNDPDRADPNSEEIILTIGQPGIHHNGGTLAFGPRDGYLYIGSGDGIVTLPEYVPTHAQDSGTLLGKILRIDVESGEKPYAIPADNPFVSTPGYAPEIWALGLRNPWGFAFDHETGDLYIPDAGWMTNEEVNFQPAESPGGENYGWPLWEGISSPGVEETVDDPVRPVALYGPKHGCAIVGGVVQKGHFIHADFCRGKVWSLQQQDQDTWETKLLMNLQTPISSIGVDETGNLYATGFADGNIYRVFALTETGD